MPEEKARLRVGSYGHRPVVEVQLFLRAVEDSHDGCLAFLNLLDRRADFHGSASVDPRRALQLLQKSEREGRYGLVNQVVGPDERLVVAQVAIASPGFWEFLGALNPLTFINDYLEGRHERRKDRAYREDAERRRMDLENQLLETRVVQERLQLATALGMNPRDQSDLLSRLAITPLLELDEVAARGMAFPMSALPNEVKVDVQQETRTLSSTSEPPLLN